MVEEELSIDKQISEEELRRQIEEDSVRTFYIKDCPELIWSEFNQYAKNDHQNDYAATLKYLLDLRRVDAKHIAVINMIMSVENKLKIHNDVIEGILKRLKEVENNG